MCIFSNKYIKKKRYPQVLILSFDKNTDCKKVGKKIVRTYKSRISFDEKIEKDHDMILNWHE